MPQTAASLAEFKRALKADVRAKDVTLVMVPRDAAVESIDEEARTAVFVMSDFTQDFVGDRMTAEGAKLARFKKNPVFLWGHEQNRLPIGTWLDVWIENGQLKGKAWFATAELDAGGDVTKSFAEACWRFVKAGILKGASVFFKILEAEWNGDGLDILAWEPAECSLVNVPCNENALVVAKSATASADLRAAGAVLELRMRAKALTEGDAGNGGDAEADHAKALDECVKAMQSMQATQAKALSDHSKIMAQHADLVGKHTKAIADADAHAQKLSAIHEDLKAAFASMNDDDGAEGDDEAKKKAAELRAKGARVLSEKNYSRIKGAMDHCKAVLDDHHASHGEPEPDPKKPGTGKGAPVPVPAKAPDFATWFASLSPEQVKQMARDQAEQELRRARGRVD